MNYFNFTILCIISCIAAFPQTGEFAYYPFNGNTSDSSGHGRHGMNIDVSYTNDRFGHNYSAAMFNGNTAYVLLPFNSRQFGNAVSITAWVYRLKTSKGVNIQGIVSNDLQSDRGVLLGALPGSNGFTVSVFNTEGSQAFCNNYTIPEGTWHFVALTYDGLQVIAYINGLFANSAALSGSMKGDELFSIGRDIYSETTGRYWGGKIDDVRFYDHALSEAEILDLYNLPDGLADDPFPAMVEVHPNPCTENLTIKASSTRFEVLLTSLQGQKIAAVTANEPIITLNTSGLSKGIYLLQFRSHRHCTVKRVIKN